TPVGVDSKKGGGGALGVQASTPAPRPPEIKFDPLPGSKQAPRYLTTSFKSTVPLSGASVKVSPAPPFPCQAKLEGDGLGGNFACTGFLAASTDYLVELSLQVGNSTSTVTYSFRTMGNKLEGVKWFTEFENPAGEPLACAAASIRSLILFATGQDKLTAEQILALGRTYNKSLDPGLDPAAIASVLKLEGAGNYHYYVLPDREEATRSLAYWLIRSGKPAIAITLAGQHGPIVSGFSGNFGAWYGDPINQVTGVVAIDPQRGDLNPLTQNRRPDKYRTAEFQTGKLLGLDEWYGDEWWFRFSYTATLPGIGNIDRNDGLYPTPHWAGNFVIIVDDGDASNPPD